MDPLTLVAPLVTQVEQPGTHYSSTANSPLVTQVEQPGTQVAPLWF